MKEKKIITWKDADINLCSVAASILNDAMGQLRSGRDSARVTYPSTDGPVERGFAQEEGSHRSLFSLDSVQPMTYSNGLPADSLPLFHVDSENIWEADELGFDASDFENLQEGDYSLIEWSNAVGQTAVNFMGWAANNAFDAIWPSISTSGFPGLTPQCWWSFQNMVKQRLEQARLELKDNLYGEGKPRQKKRQKQKSRNYAKRDSLNSKYGRQQDRS